MSDDTKTKAHIDLTDEKSVKWDMSGSMSYADYLNLDQILGAQRLLSGQHDETLFVVIHQISELWMKLILHELRAAIELVQGDDLEPAFKMLARVSKAQTQMVNIWGVLSTLTPADYMAFRDSLGQASGFQSSQYRILEFTLGNKNPELTRVFAHDPEVFVQVEAALHAPSLYDEAIRLLARRGFDVPAEKVDRDWSQPYVRDPGVEAAWLRVYRDTATYWDLYALAEKLVDVEDVFQQWRFRHMKTVERIIGFKRGTGGTSGVSYLVKALELSFFPELWSVRTLI